MTRQRISSGSPWEDKAGYCRAVRVGPFIEVAGTVALVDGVTVRADDAYAQTVNIIERVSKVLAEARASLNDVVRTRMFTTDLRHFDAIARAHGQSFSEIKPITSIYGISQPYSWKLSSAGMSLAGLLDMSTTLSKMIEQHRYQVRSVVCLPPRSLPSARLLVAWSAGPVRLRGGWS